MDKYTIIKGTTITGIIFFIVGYIEMNIAAFGPIPAPLWHLANVNILIGFVFFIPLFMAGFWKFLDMTE